jgi:hypothetical protein
MLNLCMAYVVESWPRKCGALSSIPSTSLPPKKEENKHKALVLLTESQQASSGSW